MEITIGLFIGLLVLGVLYQLFVYFRKEVERPQAAMTVEQSTLTLLRWLQRDIADTNLQSIRSLPNASNPTALPALIMESPRDDVDHLVMSSFGTVTWKKFVYYQLQPVPGKSGVGQLVYDERTDGVEIEPGKPALLTTGSTSHHRVLATDLVVGTPGDHTGFRACWLDGSGGAHDFDDAATTRAEPVVVFMTLSDTSGSTGKKTTRQLELRVKPQN
jgi:hypothetical protein